MKQFLPYSIIYSLLFISSCKKEDNSNALEQIHKSYYNGQISEGEYNGNVYYQAVMNVYDASEFIYNDNGDQVATCNYAWGNVDELCSQLNNKIVIYRVKNNIWGLPEVDTYELN